jgi:putative redox protein
LRETYGAPSILIGHSLGGAAVLAAADRIADARAVVTIAAPYDPAHVTGMFKEHVDAIRDKGELEVKLAGRPFTITRQFLDDISGKTLDAKLAHLGKALLIIHAPGDETVGIDNASHIFLAAKHPKSFVSLSGADHLLSKKADAFYVADVIAGWAGRYLGQPETMTEEEVEEGLVLVRETHAGKFQQAILTGPHRLLADEPSSLGGMNSGPAPYDYLLAGLGACTSMTVRLYAEFKKIPLQNVSVRLTHGKIHAKDCETCDTKVSAVDRIERTITLEGPLDDEQRRKLMEIADKCPVHKSLSGGIEIVTQEKR